MARGAWGKIGNLRRRCGHLLVGYGAKRMQMRWRWSDSGELGE